MKAAVYVKVFVPTYSTMTADELESVEAAMRSVRELVNDRFPHRRSDDPAPEERYAVEVIIAHEPVPTIEQVEK